jgi:hypothetical protein
MKADLTRNTFNPIKHYSRVLMQQGRVQLDADWNEQTEILLHLLRTLTADLIGPAAGPTLHCGFRIAALPAGANGQPVLTDFAIGGGRYYVNGILCEADSTPIAFVPLATTNAASQTIQVDTWAVDNLPFAAGQYVSIYDEQPPDQTQAFPQTVVQIASIDQTKQTLTLALPAGFSFGTPANPRIARVFTYLTQPDYPAPALPATGTLQVYLDVWERHLTYVEDDSIREVALGGPDTATRSKVVWQVKTLAPPATANVQNCIPALDLEALLQPETNGRLMARAKQGSASSDPCIISPTSSYAGPENQLYRVEIHRAGATWDGSSQGGLSTAATFKWSRENGSVVFPIVSGGGTNLVVLASLGRDDRFSLSAGDWVEVQDDASVLLNAPGTLLQVQSIDRPSATVTLTGAPTPRVGGTAALHPLLRRWDQEVGDPAEAGLTLGTDNAALLEEGVWLALENGIEIYFDPLDAPVAGAQNSYRTADYWLIPARTATGDVEWPKLTDASGNPVLDGNGNTIPLPKRPDGIVHNYAPLAVLTITAGQAFAPTPCLREFGQNGFAQEKARPD